jgi:hypothetical protein
MKIATYNINKSTGGCLTYQPAASGRHDRCGNRQSMPSSR